MYSNNQHLTSAAMIAHKETWAGLVAALLAHAAGVKTAIKHCHDSYLRGYWLAKLKKKLTAAQKLAKAERQKKYKWIFINGKQVRVKRSPQIDGIDADEYILQNADPIWFHQNEMWEYLDPEES